MGNQHAIGGWSDPVTSKRPGGLKDQASPLEVMSEKQLDQLAPGLTEAERERGILSYPIKLPPGLLTQVALQLKTSKRPGRLEIGELFPRAYQLLCEEKNFLFGTEARELAFIDTHGRRWKAGEGFLLSAEGLEKAPAVPEIKFDPSPANLGASCQMLRDLFEGISFPAKPATLAQYVRDCHKAVHRERERRKSVLRAKGVPNAQRVSKQSIFSRLATHLVTCGATSARCLRLERGTFSSKEVI